MKRKNILNKDKYFLQTVRTVAFLEFGIWILKFGPEVSGLELLFGISHLIICREP